MLTETQETVASALLAAARDCAPIDPVAPALGPGATLDDAYAVQDRITETGLSAGRRLVGRKIGLTSTAVQAQLGVDQPDYGMLFADMEYVDGQDIPMTGLIQPKVEAEIAFVLDRDLAAPDTTISELTRAIDHAVPALEIVDSRIRDWKIGILDTVADNASSGLFVLGTRPVRLADLDLELCGMVLERAGQPVSFGAGAACMGNPLVAALWLVRKMAAVGRPLKAGEVILSGALGPMVPARPGDAFRASIAGLGSVATRFTPPETV
ncbi:fumarylacetoacetate hydrolase family protein [Stappia taiwanensis]|uniref:Fumarylacetoacetate hydrolase family protein n=1 Tax=Stappia taiwanensis TaxID=992267 RepID=A0A838Y363_9HYPH|nr:fumarylacetoacetate hydrolase family protein [Stappia taiwanensis]MBA4613624.1 fumarylacetoacetate hydrolase family protein [Stappia taiwanensis]GGE98696.1 2-keto-4-pentenoate hydratase [Stappia taiwanensis]